MGPRHCCRGIDFYAAQKMQIGRGLQWGRGIAAAESTGLQGKVDSFPFLLQWGRGIAAAESMGRSSAALRLSRLQWGRGIAAAESGEIRHAI